MSAVVPGAIVVVANLRYASREARDGAVAASIPIQQATRDDEPGCLAYCFAADPADDTSVQVYELWSDEASLAAHFEHPNYAEMKTVLRAFERAGTSSSFKYRVDAASTVYDAEGKPTPPFGD